MLGSPLDVSRQLKILQKEDGSELPFSFRSDVPLDKKCKEMIAVYNAIENPAVHKGTIRQGMDIAAGKTMSRQYSSQLEKRRGEPGWQGEDTLATKNFASYSASSTKRVVPEPRC